MSLVNSLTPKNTEEIKPNLFVQKTNKGWRVVNPRAWNGKLRVREQLKTIVNTRRIITLAIIIFVAWSYVHDTTQLKEFYNEVNSNPIAFCNNVFSSSGFEPSIIIREDDGFATDLPQVDFQTLP